MALAMMGVGEKRMVIKVRGKDEVIRHLMDLGFAPGAEVLVVGENVAGMILIVMVNPVQAVWFLILFLVLQQIEGNLIYPRVVGSSIGLPSMWVLVAVSIGGKLFGILGILLFIPLCSVCYALFRDYINKRLQGKEKGGMKA